MSAGTVVVLNGVAGSGRSSIAAAARWPLLAWEEAAAEARAGRRVAVEATLARAVDVRAAADWLAGVEALFVGVRCPLAVILVRLGLEGAPTPRELAREHSEVHRWSYDLELDTSVLSPRECAREIARTLVDPPVPSAFGRLATLPA